MAGLTRPVAPAVSLIAPICYRGVEQGANADVEARGNVQEDGLTHELADASLEPVPGEVGRDRFATISHEVLLRDVTSEMFAGKVSQDFGIEYLSVGTPDRSLDGQWIPGNYYGESRPIIPLVVQSVRGYATEEEARWIFFIVDSGSPHIFLEPQAWTALGFRDQDHGMISIGGQRMQALQSRKGDAVHNVNLIGMPTLRQLDGVLFPNPVGVFFGSPYQLKSTLNAENGPLVKKPSCTPVESHGAAEILLVSERSTSRAQLAAKSTWKAPPRDQRVLMEGLEALSKALEPASDYQLPTWQFFVSKKKHTYVWQAVSELLRAQRPSTDQFETVSVPNSIHIVQKQCLSQM
ncbi:hypothetical protein EK21DRAFT_83408 [Setomelanomma holmii]|uniref:Uncharacterized protein n=1 Tax=Setomelanomma holmii TaxID=210430 RepID=A0A9P4HLB7_9PLEO|nr:hypothetical protein EK21DRAFT_83408 [Setomelanomma holmii]